VEIWSGAEVKSFDVGYQPGYLVCANLHSYPRHIESRMGRYVHGDRDVESGFHRIRNL
jgi:hypothetical protein